jgi:hypothetical protein
MNEGKKELIWEDNINIKYYRIIKNIEIEYFADILINGEKMQIDKEHYGAEYRSFYDYLKYLEQKFQTLRLVKDSRARILLANDMLSDIFNLMLRLRLEIKDDLKVKKNEK